MVNAGHNLTAKAAEPVLHRIRCYLWIACTSYYSTSSPSPATSQPSAQCSVAGSMNGIDVGKVKGQMHSLAFGQAMAAAAEDYKRVRGPNA